MVAVDSIPTIQKRIVGTFKIIVIIILVMLIAVLATIQWKGDAIVANVIRKVETQLQDPLHYESIHLEWFSHFPSAALRIDGLTLGPESEPLIKDGHVDIVLRLFPLLREKIVINRILISESKINIIQRDGRWSYDVFKKSDKPSENEWNALVDQVDLDRTILVYDDHEGLSLSLDINSAKLQGKLTGKLIDADIEMDGSVTHLDNGSYKLPSTINCDLSGNYKHDFAAETQKYNDWKINLEGIDLIVNGTTRKEKDQEYMDASITWKNGDAGLIKKLIPNESIKDWNEYAFFGDTEGEIKIKGKSSNGHTPQITLSSVLENGSIKIPEMDGKLSDVTLVVNYDNGNGKSSKSSVLAKLQKGSYQGHSLKSEIKINDLDHPILAMELDGSLPAGLLNFFSSSSGIHFHNGVFDIDHLKIAGLKLNDVSIKTFVDKSEADFAIENLKFNYNEDVIEINAGKIHLDEAGKVNLDAKQFGWNKAKAENVNGVFTFSSDKVDYSVTGSICQGQVESKGNISGLGSQRSVMESDWKMKGVEIKEVMASFENFDQAFITSENLEGKTNIWADVLIPYDKAGNILEKDVIARAAVDISDGELSGLKTLEDFSKYIHLEDLRRIRFNHFRNYLKVEGGKVYLPVVFIQSSAINMSVSGVHTFDQHILYNLKINAGQTAANKVRKQDAIKRFKPARKSGWINLYYVLSGTASNVQYAQDQKQVLNGFEQSAALKENLRSYLVDHFGYDVYWLEPNEWEDIPEYR